MTRSLHLDLPRSTSDPASPTDNWEDDRLLRRIGVWVTAGGLALGLRLLQASWRADLAQLPRLDAAIARGRPLVVVFWHGDAPLLLPTLAGRSGLVVSSRSFRGAVIGAIARAFGNRSCQIAPGSDTAMAPMLAELSRGGGLVAMAVDGPCGPRHRVKPGAIVLAQRCGATILPLAAVAHPRLRVPGRWDGMALPLPLARLSLRIGDPICLATTPLVDTLRDGMARVNAALDALSAQKP